MSILIGSVYLRNMSTSSAILRPKILIVEDEQAIREGLVDVFTYHGFEVTDVVDGKQGLKEATSHCYDLIVLDLMLPYIDGIQICKEIRSKNHNQAIVMLTAKGAQDEIIEGLKSGADDYIAKPFSIQELILRCKAVLRRNNMPIPGESLIELGTLKLNLLSGQAQPLENDLERDEITFSKREVELITYLLKNRSRPVSRDELLSKVWDYKRAQDITTRTVDVHIAKIRQKIENDPGDPKTLVTVRGSGYQIILE